MILAIDPGNIESGVVIIDEITLKPNFAEKMNNEELINCIYEKNEYFSKYYYVAIEMVASYGMAVGKTVFDTCVWIGRLQEAIRNVYPGVDIELIYRKDEKMNLCNSMKAKDSNIVQALIDRFAPNTPNKGKGTKKEPGWFYGFKKDIWQAYAVAVTYHDIYMKGGDVNDTTREG